MKITPLVFCHGLAGSRTAYSGICRDLASHGFIVFTMSHFDGTANYSKKKSGHELYWSSEVPHRDIEYRRSQLQIRKREVTFLLDDILTSKFLHETLGFGA